MEDRIEQLLRTKLDQEIQSDWRKIDKSNYCKYYKRIKNQWGKEEYREHRKYSGEIKEQWARLRCGNVGKAGNKGFENVRCTFCETKEETLEHIIQCTEIRKTLKDKWGSGIEELEKISKRGCIESLSSTESIESLCAYTRDFEREAREKREKAAAKS